MNKIDIHSKLEEELQIYLPELKDKDGNRKISYTLERIEKLAELLGNPQDSFPIVHVTGTSGKGSTSTIIANILTEAGYRTGLHTSPHLQVFNERCQINMSLVDIDIMYQEYQNILPTIIEVETKYHLGKPSFFEVQVILALCCFKRLEVDIAIIEVGLGGSLDGTNIVKSIISVLTTIGLDHTEILGDTIEKIAKDKCGIIKDNQKIVCGFLQESTREIAKSIALDKKSELFLINNDFGYSLTEKQNFYNYMFRKESDILELGILGEFQGHNMSCALTTIKLLDDFPCDEESIKRALRKVRVPGRMEVVQLKPCLVMLDGAHNPDKMSALTKSIERNFNFNKKIIVLGMKSGKDIDGILKTLRILINSGDQIIVTEFAPVGYFVSTDSEKLISHIKSLGLIDVEVLNNKSPLDAIKLALSLAKPENLVLVTGSLYLVGQIREYWYSSESLLVS
jgi:dihydrofolate synthase/folylpolyglutamate synthase